MKNIARSPYYVPKLRSNLNLIRKSPLTPLTYPAYVLVCFGIIPLILHDDLTTIFNASILIMIGTSLFILKLFYMTNWRDYLLLISFSLFFVFVYPISGILVTFFPDSIQGMLPTSPSVWRLSLLVGTIGWISLSLGFLNFKFGTFKRYRNYSNPSMKSIKWKYSIVLLLFLSLIGLLCRTFIVMTYFSELFYEFYSVAGVIPSTLSNFGLMATFVLLMADSKRSKITGILIFVFYCLAGLLTGQRADALIPVIMGGIFMLLYRWNLSWKFFIGIGAVLLLLVVTMPIMTRYKLLMGHGKLTTSGTDRLQIAQEAIEDLKNEQNPLNIFGETGFLDNFLLLSKRYSHMQYGGLLVSTYLDNHGYAYGESFLEGLIALVPRAIWREKPVISLGETAYQMMGYNGPGAATVPISADCYVNFGWFGVYGCMFLIGCFYAFLNKILWRCDLLCGALLAFLTYHLMIGGMGVSNIIAVPLINGMGIAVLRKFIVHQV